VECHEVMAVTPIQVMAETPIQVMAVTPIQVMAETPIQAHFVHIKLHMVCPGIEPGASW